MCSVGRERTVLCKVCVLVLVGKSIRDGTGRGYPCDSQRVERLWIKGHMHLLCCYSKVERPLWSFCFLSEYTWLTYLPPLCFGLTYDLINHNISLVL